VKISPVNPRIIGLKGLFLKRVNSALPVVSAHIGPTYKNMTSTAKPEVHITQHIANAVRGGPIHGSGQHEQKIW